MRKLVLQYVMPELISFWIGVVWYQYGSLPHSVVTVKHPNKECFAYNINSAVMSSVERLSSSRKLKLQGNQLFGTLKSVLCREVYCIVSQSWGVHYWRFYCIITDICRTSKYWAYRAEIFWLSLETKIIFVCTFTGGKISESTVQQWLVEEHALSVDDKSTFSEPIFCSNQETSNQKAVIRRFTPTVEV